MRDHPRVRNFGLGDHSGRDAIFVNTIAFLGTNPTDEPIPSGLPVIRPVAPTTRNVSPVKTLPVLRLAKQFSGHSSSGVPSLALVFIAWPDVGVWQWQPHLAPPGEGNGRCRREARVGTVL